MSKDGEFNRNKKKNLDKKVIMITPFKNLSYPMIQKLKMKIAILINLPKMKLNFYSAKKVYMYMIL